MYNATVELARQKRSRSADLESWRKDSASRQKAALLRRQNYHFDFSQLDRAADRLKSALESSTGFVTKLGAARDFYDAVEQAADNADEDTPGIYSLRKKLFSLRCRTRSVLREMRHQSRAPEFDDQALRGILRDYESLRE